MKKILFFILIIIALFSSLLFACSENSNKSKDDNLKEEVIESVNNNENKEEPKKEDIVTNEKVDEPKKEDSNIKENKYKNITIVVDPGHSSNPSKGTEPNSPDSQVMKAKDVSGAVGAFSKVPEYRFTISIGNLLKESLEKRGFNVVMTKSKEEESISNIQRAEVGNNINAALTIRLHGDSIESSSVQGASMLIPSMDNPNTKGIADISRTYGDKILKKYTEIIPIKNRGLIVRKDLTGFNWSKIPVVLIEMGFLSNQYDDLYLNNAENQKTIADAIASGIEECFK